MKYDVKYLTAESEAIFGSAARGDADAISDRDILIVDDNYETLRRRSDELKGAGFSVASYTFSKLEALAQKGALFIQHLKLESNILSDRRRRLTHILMNFSPKSSYQQEIESNKYLAALISTHPATSNGALWAADVLYVAARNFGILSLAERGIHHYSYRMIADAMADTGMVGKNGHSSLLKLRLFKSLYRAHETVRNQTVQNEVDNALINLPMEAFPRTSIPIDPYMCISNARVNASGVAYHRLRRMEKWLISASELDTNFRSLHVAKQVSRWIDNPRAYAQISINSEPIMIVEMQNILKNDIDIHKYMSNYSAAR
jgi:hypothetical protein